MAATIKHDYEVSSEGAVRHWEVPYARLEDTSPVETNPCAVLSRVPGTQSTGTILTLDPALELAMVDFTCSMVYRQDVRNVLTYAADEEATFGALNIGDPVYYDRSATMPTTPANVYLSTSPLDADGVANPLFGHIALLPEQTADSFPLGDTTASTERVGVMQIGAGG